ncbi:MAG: FAD-binding oxidoreductase, partial [Candidatus Binatales bacterium]
RMARVVAYEPEDMTIVAIAGLTLGEVNRLTGARRQRLCVDPPNPGLCTLGAIIGAAQAGPLRHSEGLVRDLLIGIQFVGHGGRVVRAGGRVVKNVAGYDLMKLMTGSFGTLGIVTEATFKVRPLPEHYALAATAYTNMESAFATASRLHDALPLMHLEVLSPGYGELFGYSLDYLLLAGFGGNRDELKYQRAKIVGMLDGTTDILEDTRAVEAYQRLRDLAPPAGALAAQLSVLPAALAQCLAASQRSMLALDGTNRADETEPSEHPLEFRAHVGAGVAEISVNRVLSRPDASRLIAQWRAAAREAGGHLRLTAVAQSLRGAVPAFDSPGEGAMKLMSRLKASFDPAGVFNPGCFVGGI